MLTDEWRWTPQVVFDALIPGENAAAGGRAGELNLRPTKLAAPNRRPRNSPWVC